MYKMSEQCRESVVAKFEELVKTSIEFYTDSPEYITKATELLACIDTDLGRPLTQEEVVSIQSLYPGAVGNIIMNRSASERSIAMDMYVQEIEKIINKE